MSMAHPCQFRNLGGIKLRTVDLTVDYAFHTESHGDFTFSTAATYLNSYQYQALPSQPFFEFAGAVSNSPQAGRTQPRWRAYSTVEWSYGPWDAVLANNFIDSVKDEGAGGFTFANAGLPAVGGQHLFDLRRTPCLQVRRPGRGAHPGGPPGRWGEQHRRPPPAGCVQGLPRQRGGRLHLLPHRPALVCGADDALLGRDALARITRFGGAWRWPAN